jgi:hypothetical protein
MTDITEPTWPAPPRHPGSRIRHGWRCTRGEGIETTTRRDPNSGAIIEVEVCLECDATDLAERLLSQARPDPGPAAA